MIGLQVFEEKNLDLFGLINPKEAISQINLMIYD